MLITANNVIAQIVKCGDNISLKNHENNDTLSDIKDSNITECYSR